MRTRHTALPGAAAALIIAAACFAQPDKNTPTTRPDQPRDRVTDTRTDGRADPSVLRQLEGVWNVQVNVSPSYWKCDEHKDMSDLNKNNPNNPNDPNKKPSSEPNPSTKDATTTTTGSNSTYNGYAETKLLFGGHILKHALVIPDMAVPPGISHDRNLNDAGVDSNTYRALNYICFDRDSQMYSFVCMDNRQGRMHHDTGTYDAGQRRIVFNGWDKRGMDRFSTTDRIPITNPSTTPGTTNPSTPPSTTDRIGKNPEHPTSTNPMPDKTTGPGAFGYSMDNNVRVVVEILSPDQFRVTMHKVDIPMSTDTTRTTTTDNNRDVNNPNTPSNTNPNQPNTNTTFTPASAIYTATYTRAKGDDINKYRGMLDSFESRMPTR